MPVPVDHFLNTSLGNALESQKLENFSYSDTEDTLYAGRVMHPDSNNDAVEGLGDPATAAPHYLVKEGIEQGSVAGQSVILSGTTGCKGSGTVAAIQLRAGLKIITTEFTGSKGDYSTNETVHVSPSNGMLAGEDDITDAEAENREIGFVADSKDLYGQEVLEVRITKDGPSVDY